MKKILILTLALCATQVFAQGKKSKAPKAGEAPVVRIAEPTVHKLKNGMTLLLVEDHRLPMVSFQLKMDIEPIDEMEMAGMVDMVGELLGAGTMRSSKEELDLRIDQLGATYITFSDGIYASGLKRSALGILDLISEMAMSSTFPQKELEKSMTKMLSSVSLVENDPNAISSQVGDVLRYSKAHPYGNPVTEETLGQVNRKYVKAYYDAFFTPQNAYLVVVGDMGNAEAIEAVTKRFQHWGKKDAEKRAIKQSSSSGKMSAASGEQNSGKAADAGLNTADSDKVVTRDNVERSATEAVAKEKGPTRATNSKTKPQTTSLNADQSASEVASNNEQALGVMARFKKASQIGKKGANLKENHVALVDRPSSVQSVIDVTYSLILTPNDPNAMAVKVMNGILGGGAFNARLNKNLREDKAFTYGAYSSLNSDKYVGAFSAGASVRTSVTDSAITEILYEMQNMIDEDVSDEELQLTKNMIAGSFSRSLEDPRTIARFALNKTLYHLPADHYKSFLQRLDAVSKEDVRAMAQLYLHPNNAHILVVGNKDEVYNKLEKFTGRTGVEPLDIYGNRYREELTQAPPGVTVGQVIDDYITAIGGRENLMGRKSETITMSAEMQGMPVELVSYRQYPNKYMSKLTVQGREMQKVVFDGVNAVTHEMGKKTELVEIELADVSYDAEMNLELKHKDFGFEIYLLGVAQLKGGEAYKINIITMDGTGIKEYYDSVTKLKVKREEERHTREGMTLVTTYYDDYQEVGGILFPHKITQSAGMKLEFTVKSIELDTKLDKELFEID